jgi:hypothetical protein
VARSAAATALKVIGSVARTPNSSVEMNRPAASDSAMPDQHAGNREPQAAADDHSEHILPRMAPSAIRMPISCVR